MTPDERIAEYEAFEAARRAKWVESLQSSVTVRPSCESVGMPNESAAQRRASKLRQDRDRCREAAQALRHRIVQGRYTGLRHSDELLALAPVLDTAGMLLDQLPDQLRRDVLAAVAELLDDAPEKPSMVDPITRGDGH